MNIYKIPIVSNKRLQEHTYLLKAYSPDIASEIKPGQFCNIKVSENDFPLLRRPFSICDVSEDHIYFMYDVHGEGTRLLSSKRENDTLDILASLGNGFNLNDDFDTGIIIAGGIGAAPFPYLTRKLLGKKQIKTFIGGRSAKYIQTYGLENFEISSDNGEVGFKGNVVQLFENHLSAYKSSKIKVFGCGPTPMLRALQQICNEENINCELSMECAMACGFGICQGCPIEKAEKSESYFLVCKDGPVFNSKDIVI